MVVLEKQGPNHKWSSSMDPDTSELATYQRLAFILSGHYMPTKGFAKIDQG